MVRPDTDIPHQLNGLAKDLRDGSDLELNDVYREALRRGLEDLASDLMKNGNMDPEIRDQLRDLNKIRER